MIPRALTIAGSDSGGGAGIQADLKTFTVHRVFGTSAVTALTAQNTTGVSGILAIPADFVRRQIDAVLSDIGADAIKTGMLANAEITRTVAEAIAEHRVRAVVVDPVLVAQSGASLLMDDAVAVLIAELLPLATIVTPNLAEAETLTGEPVRSVEQMKRAAAALCAMGARACLVKGGHLDSGDAVDILCAGGEIAELRASRVASRHTHGTGCQLAAAIAANLAAGAPLATAVGRAKQFITAAIRDGLQLGAGCGPANPLAWIRTTCADREEG
ncbi:MAG TPA: bifunctional hydroxymethylpyrimidine kinase/phosphomethylpyrimidine kinase [Terriglobales bacterium]|nr:bifunctional hydroxymethylpyrimidine kinase/phosphomethylpyrimidine kinase [Terriglobales bacterium]